MKKYGKISMKCVSLMMCLLMVVSAALIDRAEDDTAYAASLDKASRGEVVAHGIDVSKWQGEINWKKVAASGIEYAILRVGYTGSMDTTFEANYKGAKEAGIDVGVYIYTHADSVSEARKDADDCLKWIKGKKFEYPIYFDIEGDEQKDNDMNKNTELALAFLDRVSSKGYLCGVYTSAYWYRTYIDYERIAKKYETWVAHYADHTYNDNYGYSDKHGMWQYTSSGTVAGIDGRVDLDVAYKDYPKMVKEGGYNGYEPEVSTDTESDIDTDANTDTATDTDKPVDSESDTDAPIIYGDLDFDGQVDMEDVIYLQRVIALIEPINKKAQIAADVNDDGELSMEDVVLVQRKIALLIIIFPIEV